MKNVIHDTLCMLNILVSEGKFTFCSLNCVTCLVYIIYFIIFKTINIIKYFSNCFPITYVNRYYIFPDIHRENDGYLHHNHLHAQLRSFHLAQVLNNSKFIRFCILIRGILKSSYIIKIE